MNDSEKRPRGRPRIHPVKTQKRPRGRPRKTTLVQENDGWNPGESKNICEKCGGVMDSMSLHSGAVRRQCEKCGNIGIFHG